MKTIFTGVVVAGFCACMVQAEDITGTVTDALTGDPISGAAVSVVGESPSATSSGSGTYTITGLPDGTYTVRVEATGYDPQERDVTLGTASAVPGQPLRRTTSAGVWSITRNRLGVSLPSQVNQAQLSLYRMDGSLVATRSISAAVQNEADLSVRRLSRGSYLWKLEWESGAVDGRLTMAR